MMFDLSPIIVGVRYSRGPTEPIGPSGTALLPIKPHGRPPFPRFLRSKGFLAPPPPPPCSPPRHHAIAQDLPDQEEAGQEDAAEPPHPPLDPHAHRQHHQVQREAQALAPHQARVLSGGGEVPDAAAWRRRI